MTRRVVGFPETRALISVKRGPDVSAEPVAIGGKADRAAAPAQKFGSGYGSILWRRTALLACRPVAAVVAGRANATQRTSAVVMTKEAVGQRTNRQRQDKISLIALDRRRSTAPEL